MNIGMCQISASNLSPKFQKLRHIIRVLGYKRREKIKQEEWESVVRTLDIHHHLQPWVSLRSKYHNV